MCPSLVIDALQNGTRGSNAFSLVDITVTLGRSGCSEEQI